MKTVCAWCGVVIADGPEPISHGCCPRCYNAQLADFAWEEILGLAAQAKAAWACRVRGAEADDEYKVSIRSAANIRSELRTTIADAKGE